MLGADDELAMASPVSNVAMSEVQVLQKYGIVKISAAQIKSGGTRQPTNVSMRSNTSGVSTSTAGGGRD
jgi:hypothetical protein